MGTIRVHEFMSLDGVIDAPTWTFDYGFGPLWGRTSAISCPAAKPSCWDATLRDVRAGLVDPDS